MDLPRMATAKGIFLITLCYSHIQSTHGRFNAKKSTHTQNEFEYFTIDFDPYFHIVVLLISNERNKFETSILIWDCQFQLMCKKYIRWSLQNQFTPQIEFHFEHNQTFKQANNTKPNIFLCCISAECFIWSL